MIQCGGPSKNAIQPTVFYPYRLAFVQGHQLPHDQSRGSPLHSVAMWARQGTGHTKATMAKELKVAEKRDAHKAEVNDWQEETE